MHEANPAESHQERTSDNFTDGTLRMCPVALCVTMLVGNLELHALRCMTAHRYQRNNVKEEHTHLHNTSPTELYSAGADTLFWRST